MAVGVQGGWIAVDRLRDAGLLLVRHGGTGLTEWRFVAEESSSARAASAKGEAYAAATGTFVQAPAAASSDGEVAQRRVDASHAAYVKLGRPDTWWWWAADESVAALGQALDGRYFALVDDFLPPSLVTAIAREAAAAHVGGLLSPGALGGGRNGSNLTYQHASVRGDVIGWFDGNEKPWQELPVYLKRIQILVNLLRKGPSSNLKGIGSLSRAMVACYPGDGTHYELHCDNACDSGEGERCNGRRLTAILYLNENWHRRDGGQLRIYVPNDASCKNPVAEIEPIAGGV
mmetsp:Transcript_2669/g.6447  ORF Transcript_2669/g.6447 Transcript_2669/m.6447 type:complete len:289 (+) Transcript_2669:93-959(+)